VTLNDILTRPDLLEKLHHNKSISVIKLLLIKLLLPLIGCTEVMVRISRPPTKI